MDKPTMKIRQSYDYYKCEAYIADKLGVQCLQDFAGKYTRTERGNHVIRDDLPYQDFTHFLFGNLDYHNGSEITMPYWAYDEAQDWQKKILDAFKEEFGENAKFWVEW